MKYGVEFLHNMIIGHKKAARQSWKPGEYIYMVEGYDVPIENWRIQFPCQEPTPFEKDKGYIHLSSHIDKVWDGFREIGWFPNFEESEADDWYYLE